MLKVSVLTMLVAMSVAAAALPLRAEDAAATREEAYTAHDEARTLEARTTEVETPAHHEREAWLMAQIQFGFDDERLSHLDRRQIARIAPALIDAVADGASIVVHGHSDALGTDAYNLDLSRRRALRVKQHLVHEWGMEPMRIHVRAWGADRPEAGRVPTSAFNRRVEIVLLEITPSAGRRYAEARLANRHAHDRRHRSCGPAGRQILDLDDFGGSMTRTWVGRDCLRGY